MNEKEQLRLQSYLDGELGESERREIAGLLEKSPAANALLAELSGTRAALRGNEMERTLECSREFYWNGIAHAIERDEPIAVKTRGEGLLSWMRHYTAQLAGAAAGIAVIAFTFTAMTDEPEVDSVWEVLDPDMAMVNYRDFENGITVVMLYDQSTPAFTAGD